MKIGLVCPYYFDRYGGVQSLILAMKTELTKLGHEVRIIAPRPRGGVDSEIAGDLIHIGSSAEVKIRTTSTVFPVSMSIDQGEIDEILEREKFDVLHVHEPWMPVLANQIVQRANCPVIGTLHAAKSDTLFNKSVGAVVAGYFRAAAKKVAVMTAVSDHAGDYASISSRSRENIRLVPNGIDLNYFNPRKTKKLAKFDNSLKTIAYVGRLEKRKGLNYLLKAYKELLKHHQDVELVIAGAGPLEKSLKDYVRRHKLPNVSFLGYISDEDKRSLLKTADLYCSPAVFGESFGIVLLEAMAMGAVTVAGNNPGYSSVMSDRGRLSLIDPLSTKDFANRLSLMLYDEDMRQLWRDWAKEYVKQYDFSVITKQYEAIYKEVVNGEEAKT